MYDPEGLNTAVWPVEADHFITPTDRFFTRSHAPVPPIAPAAWRLQVDGLVSRPRGFSLEELGRNFARREVAATLVCAGLRRDEFLPMGPLAGELPWGPEPAGTGRWAGIALREVLEAVGVEDGARHVEFTGLDQVERLGTRFGFGASIDLEKALRPEVLLASELNGAPLPPEHGFPMRTLVPGWIGARSVKWLGRITLRAEPTSNYFQTKAYRVQRELNPRDPRDVSAGYAIDRVPLNALFLDPSPGKVLAAGTVQVRGWAIGTEGRPVAGVEVSPNGGKDWTAAHIAVAGEGWTWTFWTAAFELQPGKHVFAVRAIDAGGDTQPEHVEATWNVKGYCNNAWHRVAVRVE